MCLEMFVAIIVIGRSYFSTIHSVIYKLVTITTKTKDIPFRNTQSLDY